MNSRDYFVLGCKLFGVYCLFISVPFIVNAINFLVAPTYSSEGLGNIVVLAKIEAVEKRGSNLYS